MARIKPASKEQYERINRLLLKTSPVEVYQMVLRGELKQFPLGFWGMPENYKYAQLCTGYMVEVLMGYDPQSEEFKKFMRKANGHELFKQYKLSSIYAMMFNGSKYDLLINAYGNIYAIWEVQSAVPRGYWDSFDNVANAIRWLFEYKYKINIVELSNSGILRLPSAILETDGFKEVIGGRHTSIKELIGKVYPQARLDNIVFVSKYSDDMNSGNVLDIYKKLYLLKIVYCLLTFGMMLIQEKYV